MKKSRILLDAAFFCLLFGLAWKIQLNRKSLRKPLTCLVIWKKRSSPIRWIGFFSLRYPNQLLTHFFCAQLIFLGLMLEFKRFFRKLTRTATMFSGLYICVVQT